MARVNICGLNIPQMDTTALLWHGDPIRVANNIEMDLAVLVGGVSGTTKKPYRKEVEEDQLI